MVKRPITIQTLAHLKFLKKLHLALKFHHTQLKIVIISEIMATQYIS